MDDFLPDDVLARLVREEAEREVVDPADEMFAPSEHISEVFIEPHVDFNTFDYPTKD